MKKCTFDRHTKTRNIHLNGEVSLGDESNIFGIKTIMINKIVLFFFKKCKNISVFKKKFIDMNLIILFNVQIIDVMTELHL